MSNELVELRKVQPTTVHKKFVDDVLVYIERGALPLSLPRRLVEEARLEAEDESLLRRYYVDGQGETLCLRFVPTVSEC